MPGLQGEAGLTVLVVTAVLLFFGLGIVLLILMDHKARLPGGFTSDPFSVVGMRRDHPFEAFVTGAILLAIIAALLLSVIAALTGQFKLVKKKEAPKLIASLAQERTAERLRHFHNMPVQLAPTLGKKNVCAVCHGDFPHSKKKEVRALLNMHTQFIGCMTCHADPKKVPEKTVELRWLNFSGIAVKGQPFGTRTDPETGFFVETDDFHSKIVAYSTFDGAERLLESTQDDPEVREFAKIYDKLSNTDRDAVKKRFHRLISDKGRFCSRCHTEAAKSFMPFRALGFSDSRVADLTNLNIIGLMEKYKRFYVPKLTSHDETAPEAEAPRAPTRKPDSGLRKDPRSWWKGTYDTPPKKSPP